MKYRKLTILITIAIAVFAIGVIISLLNVQTVSADPGWYNSIWDYRRPITINNAGSDISEDFQVKIDDFDTATLVSAGKMLSTGNDIRFTRSNGSTVMPYYIESGINTSTTDIWVKITADSGIRIPEGNSTIYMYYGNPSASSASDGNATFEFFDDFEGTSLDDKWTVDGAISYSVSGSILTVTDAPSSTWNVWKGIHASINNIQGIRIEAKGVDWVHSSSDLFQWGALLGEQASGNKNLGMYIGDGHSSTSEGYLNYYYDTSGLSKGNIEGQQPVDLVTQRDQNGNCKFFKDGVEQQIGTETSTNSIDTVMLLVNRYSTYVYPTTKIDRILVRKYVSSEPSASVGSEEVIVAAGITVTESEGATNVAEGGATDTYEIVLDSQPTHDVIITISFDAQITTNPLLSLIFTSANWDVPQTVIVTAVDDDIVEGNYAGAVEKGFYVNTMETQ